MNGINKLKVCKSNGRKEENDDEEDEEKEVDIAQPGTSRDGLLEEPNWNTSTRQLYADNFKSTSSAASCKYGSSSAGTRERIPSVTDSTSSDDSCVYMYKGDGSQRNGNDVNKHVNCSSPEMDYLEMDFDPCQSNGHDSSDGSYSCEVGDIKEEETNDVALVHSDQERNSTPTNIDECSAPSPQPNQETVENTEFPQPSTSKIEISKIPLAVVEKKADCPKGFKNHNDQGPKKDINIEEELVIAENETINALLHSHLSEGPYNRACCLSNINEAMCSIYRLGGSSKDEERVQELLKRNEITSPSDMPISQFLNEMSHGHLTIPMIQDIFEQIFGSSVSSRFFSPYPSVVNLSAWLQSWAKKGAVIILCWNFPLTEDNCNFTVNSSWHYQLVFNISSVGIHLYPHGDLIHEKTLRKLLTNPSDVLIHRDEVMTHWNPHSDLAPLMCTSDHSWKQYNVLGQVVNVIREAAIGKSDDEIRYVKIPSNHRPGILILMRSNNIYAKELLSMDNWSTHENPLQ